MTTTQKNELTSVGSEVTDVNDARQAALDKVAQYYDDIEQHYVKAKAARSLQTFCKQTMTSYFGPEVCIPYIGIVFMLLLLLTD